MNRLRISHRLLIAALALSLIIAVPSTALAGHHPAIGAHHLRTAPTQAAFVFGRKGGNIRPFTGTIDNGGQIALTGLTQPAGAARMLTSQVPKGLLKLAEAADFFQLPTNIQCGTTLMPDTATIFVTVNTASSTKTVNMHGGCNSAFEQLWSVLAAIVGVA